jgi:hypothetical protein
MDIPYIARRELTAEASDGRRFTMVVGVGAPHPGEHDDWVCDVAIEGLPHHPWHIHGADSLQALTLAIAHARYMLQHFTNQGGSLYWLGDEASGPMSVEELFGGGA